MLQTEQKPDIHNKILSLLFDQGTFHEDVAIIDSVNLFVTLRLKLKLKNHLYNP